MFGIAVNVRQFLLSSMKKWKTELTSYGQQLGVVNINRGIFQGDSLSPLLFVLCVVPLSFVLRRSRAGYEWGGREFKIDHFLFMDDLKLFGKSYEQIDSLVQTVHTISTDIGMFLLPSEQDCCRKQPCYAQLGFQGSCWRAEGEELTFGHWLWLTPLV